MVAGDIDFVFASRNERSFKQIEVKTWNNYGEENAWYLSTYVCSAMLVRLAQTISSKYYILLFPLNLIITIIVILLAYSTVCSDVLIVLHQAIGGFSL